MKVFLDTNVFLYAFLDQDVDKKRVAVEAIAKAVRERNGCVSTQVAKEFCNVMLKGSSKSPEDLLKALELFDRFDMVNDTMELVRGAIRIKSRYDLQYYDSLMLAAAESERCGKILTEDLNDGQEYCGIKAVNPFKNISTDAKGKTK